jgi:hypothetical protein
MSAPFSDLVITNQGTAMSASAFALAGVITITSVQFGSGFPGLSDNVPGYTALKTPVCNGQITGQNVLVAGQATIRVNLAGTAIPSTFQINEIGVFASFAGGGSQLVAYMSTGAATGDTLTLGSPVVKDYAILVTFSQGVITSVNISLIQVVGLHAPSHLDNGIDPIPAPSTARSGLLLKNPNDQTQGLIGTNPPSWAPVLLVIKVNTTLFVSTTGNNSTALPNDPAHPWLTLQGALNFLIAYFITPSAIVTISMAGGTYASSSAITVNHPNASQINIIGSTGTNHTITACTGQSGSSGNYQVSLTISGTNDISTGQRVLIKGIAGFPGYVLNGLFTVSSSGGSSVIINVPFSGTAPIETGQSMSGGTIQSITTILSQGSGASGLLISNYGLGLLQNVFVLGTSAGSGISCTGSMTANTVGVAGFNIGLNCASGINSFTAVFAVSNAHGLVVNNAAAAFINCGASFCSVFGWELDTSGSITLGAICTSVNNTSGLFCAGNSSVVIQTFFSVYNGAFGIVAQSGGSVIVGPGGTAGVANNGSVDLEVTLWGLIFKGSGTTLTFGTASQSINTVTTSGIIAP